MTLTRRAFNCGAAAAAAAPLLPMPAHATVPPRDEALVLARATDVDLSAQETAVVLAPVPPPRRPPQKPKGGVKPAKGAKPAAPRMWIVLRDVMTADRAPTYDLFLVLEGPDVFRPTTTSQPVGAWEPAGGTVNGDDNRRDRNEAVAFDITEALAKLSKVRGYHMRRLRLSIVRRPVIDASNAETVPPVAAAPEVGAIELVQW
jgi:hypothetical protein